MQLNDVVGRKKIVSLLCSWDSSVSLPTGLLGGPLEFYSWHGRGSLQYLPQPDWLSDIAVSYPLDNVGYFFVP